MLHVYAGMVSLYLAQPPKDLGPRPRRALEDADSDDDNPSQTENKLAAEGPLVATSGPDAA